MAKTFNDNPAKCKDGTCGGTDNCTLCFVAKLKSIRDKLFGQKAR